MEEPRKPIRLQDGGTTRCVWRVLDAPPLFWRECQDDATVLLEVDEQDELNEWLERLSNPKKRFVDFRPGRLYFCDRHYHLLHEYSIVGRDE